MGKLTNIRRRIVLELPQHVSPVHASFIYSGLAVGVASPSLDIFIVSFVSENIVPFWIKYLRSYLRIHLGKTSPFKKYRLGVWILHMRYFLPRPRSIKSLK